MKRKSKLRIKKFIDPMEEALEYIEDERWKLCTWYCKRGIFGRAVEIARNIHDSYSNRAHIMVFFC